MSLGIFGDSHAYNITNSWPYLLNKHYHTEHYAMFGTSVWNSFKKFSKHYSKHSYVVFTYTNANRIHHLPEEIEHLQFSISAPLIKNAVPKLYEKQMQAVWEAHRLIYDLQLAEYINQHVFNDVNLICKNNNIRLINLLPYENAGFDDSIKTLDLSQAAGPCITGLRWVSDCELEQPLSDKPDVRACHLSPENNVILHKMILDLLNSNEQCTIHLKDSEFFAK